MPVSIASGRRIYQFSRLNTQTKLLCCPNTLFMKTRCFISIFTLFFSLNSLPAQKLFGGEITVRQTGTYSAIATVYIASSINVTLDTIELCWGDGSCQALSLQFSEFYPDLGVKYHQFQASHIYGYEDFFTLRVSNCCWAQNIQNISLFEPTQLELSTEFFMSINDPLFGENQMPLLDYKIISGNQWTAINYESNLYDNEGDEIKISVCEIDYLPNFLQPTHIYGSPLNLLFLDTLSGSFQWISPQLAGNYIFAFCVEEYRNDILISSFTKNILAVIHPPVSTTSLSPEKEITIFPNPADGFLYVDVPVHWTDVKLRLCDLNGWTVAHPFPDYSFNLDHLKSGLYLLELRSEKHFFTKKVIIK